MRISLCLLVCTAAVLSACNMALSDHPMLSAEPRSTLKLKDGLWAGDDPECKVDSSRPVIEWPNCAKWLAIEGERIVGAADAKPDEMPIDILIADGNPPILEFPLNEKGEKQAKAYAYIVIEPSSLESNGHAVDVLGWFVACGVQNRNERDAGTASEIKHFPGMDENCHPRSVDALRAAAAAGPQGSDKKFRWRWIRANAN
jgi:hypothetical protein